MKPHTTRAFMSLTSRRLKTDLAYVGITLGILLMIIAMSLDIYFEEKSIAWPILISHYQTNPVHWVIATSPFFLGVLFYLMGKMIGDRESRLEEKTARDTKQYHLLEEFINNFESEISDERIIAEFDNKIVAEKLTGFKIKLHKGRIEERIRNWESDGLAQFAEILRRQQNISALADDVLRFLVKYVDCNQGSVFIANGQSGETMLEMKACYAYDRKKYIDAVVPVGQGLVGQCFLERETIILYDVPKDYIKITSGLGTATPAFVAIIPVKTEDAVTGIIEIASFKRLADHEVRFLERACRAFASVIATVMTNQNVTRLLQESQQQTEELRSQEEEMRQNLEELETIQEQMTRQLDENLAIKRDLEQREHVLTKTTILSESDLFGTITFVNSKFCEVSQYSAAELVGRPHNILRHPDMPSEVFKIMWTTIKSGRTFQGIVKNRKKDGSHYWVDATIVPITENGKTVKYIGARYHIKDDAIAEKLFEQQLRRLGLLDDVLSDIRLVS